ncbi:dihydroorotate dehydrogenase [Sporolactobacillus sp. STCC-11]|uniref:dihydroorotate dehydrogenase n=1 Tax=Sporolactobacillus caesalpiniae TaxID=3230362 RepID=UPI0033910E89
MRQEPDLSVNIADLSLQSPVMPACGTFNVSEGAPFDPGLLGAFIPTSVSMNAHSKEQASSIFEAGGSMLNAATFQSDAIDFFEMSVLPTYNAYRQPLIANISGESVDEFTRTVDRLSKQDKVAAFEVNLSCPDRDNNRQIFGFLSETTYSLIRNIRSVTDKPLIVKLSPNVSRIQEITLAAEQGGANAFTVANAYSAMSIDIETRKPKLGNVIGSLSGATIKPLIVRLVFQTHQVTHLPIIGSGGIMSGSDAIEMILAGASAVQIGTANFLNSNAMIEITNEIRDYIVQHELNSAAELVGQVDFS